jgi:hypothetical protein
VSVDPGCMARGHGMGLSWAHDLLVIGTWSEVSMGVWHGSYGQHECMALHCHGCMVWGHHGRMACGYPSRMAWGCPRHMAFHVMLAIGNPVPWVWYHLVGIFFKKSSNVW